MGTILSWPEGGDDHIIGKHLASIIYGGQGADTIEGATGYVSGDAGNDRINDVSGTIFGGEGDDIIAASGTSVIFGNSGNDIIQGASFNDSSSIYGGKGDDSIGGESSNDFISGDDGNDTINASSNLQSGDTIFGGNGNDLVNVSHGLGFGNSGDDNLFAAYSASVYGGQGDDYVTGVGSDSDSQAGRNLLSGDLGNDTVESGVNGQNTLIGGRGADQLILDSHDASHGNLVVVNSGDSTANQGTAPGVGDESNLDHVSGFDFGSDRMMIVAHPSAASSGVGTYVDPTAHDSEASAFQAAYLYTYGDGTAAHAAHVPGSGYLAVQESNPTGDSVYLFTIDHTAVVFEGATITSFQAGAIIQG